MDIYGRARNSIRLRRDDGGGGRRSRTRIRRRGADGRRRQRGRASVRRRSQAHEGAFVGGALDGVEHLQRPDGVHAHICPSQPTSKLPFSP